MTDKNNSAKKVLVIFAHPDDELSCVGTMANHVEAGDEVTLSFLTYGENASTLKGTHEEIKAIRIAHTKKISEILGVKIKFLGFPDSKIEYNTENAYKIASLIKEVKPNLIITWNKSKRIGSGHPDHRKTADLVLDAISYARYKKDDCPFEPHRERINFYTYYDPTQDRQSSLVYTDVSEQEEKIRQFIDVYKEVYGDWPVENYKFSSMTYYGRLFRVKYAEVFAKVMYYGNIPKLLP